MFVALLLLISFEAKTQQAVLAGKVTDYNTRQPIPYAQVGLLKAGEEQILVGQITSVEGAFSFAGLQAGQYRLQIAFVGYSTMITPEYVLKTSTARIDTIQVVLSPLPVQLEMMQVTAESMTVAAGIDRKTYRVADFETALGGNVTDLLNKLPSVSVSPDGEVSVRGSTDFVVYLNGRPVQTEASLLLAQISASSIESIDVITIPTARFDAQGKGGIININTKTTAPRGWSVSVNGLTGGAPWNHQRDPFNGYHLTDNRYGGGLNVLFSEKGWTLYSSISYNFRNVNATRSGEARILQQGETHYKHLVASGTKPEWYENTTANFGVDYNLNKRSKLSASWFYGNRTEWRQAHYLYQMFYADEEKNPVAEIPLQEQWIFNPNEGIRRGVFNTFNLGFDHKISKDASLNINVLYENSLLSQTVDNPNIHYDLLTGITGETLLRYRQEDRTPLNGLRLSVDYSGKLKSGMQYNIGIQPQFFGINGGFSYDTLNVETQSWGAYADLENRVELKRDVYAGYADISGKYSKLQYKAGLRIETTDQLLKIDNPSYFSILERESQSEIPERHTDLFPSLHLSYPITGSDQLTLASSRRINRSPLKNMAPFLYRRHLEVYVVGDPELKPEYISVIELSYRKSVGKHRLTLTGFYRGVNNAVFRVNTTYPEEQVLIRSFTNSGHTTAMGTELDLNLEFGKKLKLYLGGSLYDYSLKAEIFGYQEQQRGILWGLKGNGVCQITGSLRSTVDFDLRSARITAQGRDELLGTMNASLSWAPANLKGWNFALRGLNLLNSNIHKLNTRAYDTQGTQIFYQYTEFQWLGPVVELTIQYQLNARAGSSAKQDAEFGRREF